MKAKNTLTLTVKDKTGKIYREVVWYVKDNELNAEYLYDIVIDLEPVISLILREDNHFDKDA